MPDPIRTGWGRWTMIMRLKGIKKATAKGKVYYYHRATGKAFTKPYGTAEFVKEWETFEGLATAHAVQDRSLGGLIGAYRDSPEFSRLKPRTRADYEKIFLYLKPIAKEALTRFDQPAILELRDRVFKAKRRHFANYTVKVLCLLLAWGQLRRWVKVNHALGVPLIAKATDAPRANRPWTAQELRTVYQAAPPHLKLPIALGVLAGMREGDMVSLTWAAYDGTALTWRQSKTGDDVWASAIGELKGLLDEARSRRNSPLVVAGARGASYTASGFRAVFFRLIRKLRKEGKVGPGLTYHGLRHTLGTYVIEGGGTDRHVNAMLGQRSPAMGHHYSRSADQKRLSREAVTALRKRQENE